MLIRSTVRHSDLRFVFKEVSALCEKNYFAMFERLGPPENRRINRNEWQR